MKSTDIKLAGQTVRNDKGRPLAGKMLQPDVPLAFRRERLTTTT